MNPGDSLKEKSFRLPDSALAKRTYRNLPHWHLEGAIFWVTFRLADSLPQEKLRTWKDQLDAWSVNRPKPWSDDNWDEYEELFGHRLEEWLDAGYGSCALARPAIQEIVRDAILRFDGERLRLHAGVIMPNHAHLLIEPEGENDLSLLLKGMKGASARQANKLLGTTGEAFWWDESYDHIVRSEVAYRRLWDYIVKNPIKAKLQREAYWLHPQA